MHQYFMVFCIEHDSCKGKQDSQFVCLLNKFETTALGLQSVLLMNSCTYLSMPLKAPSPIP